MLILSNSGQMAVYRRLVWFLLLLGLAFGSSLSPAPTNSSTHSPYISTEFGNKSNHTSSNTFHRATNILGLVTPTSQGPGEYPPPTPTSRAFQDTIESVSLAKSSSKVFVAEPTSISSIALSNISFDEYQSGQSTASSRIPGTGRPPFIIPSNSSKQDVMNSSLHTIYTSQPHGPLENDSVYPAFREIPSDQRLANASEVVPFELQLHRSRNNSDLYPPTNFSNVTIRHNCSLLHVNQTFKPRISIADKRSMRFNGSQDANSSDLYPTWSPCAEKDAQFFEFTEKNIRESEVIEWYGRWTVEAIYQRPEKYAHYGEWRLFYSWWLQENDFHCSYDFSECRNAKSREDVQKIYPGLGNRELARRIYFITLMYDYLHDHTRMMQDTFKNLQVDLLSHTKELIDDFTQHGNAHGEQLCKLYKIFAQAGVNAGIGLLNTVIAGFTGPLPGTSFGKMLNPVIGWMSPFHAGKEVKINFNLYGYIQDQVMGLTLMNWQTWQGLVEDRISREQPIINTGMGRGWAGMCASAEGDFTDQGDSNKQNLEAYLSQSFQRVREAIYGHFHDIYTGSIRPQPGKPSMMAAIMANRKWVEEDSIVSQLEDNRPVTRFIRTATMKQVISKLLSESQNWMKCTHHKDAQKMCKIATKAREQGSKGYDVDRSRFCPHPESDPTYVCELGAWYFADEHQHQRQMSAINTLETFWGNEFNFKLEDFMVEVHENYERCQNDCAQMSFDRLAFDPQQTAARGFVIPVCVSDYIQLDDFLKKGPRRWHFPSVCGDFTSNETSSFLKAANMGPDSQVANTQSIQQLWRDRIPRELEGMRPYNYYMALCRHNIRFPDKWKWTTRYDKLHNLKNTFNHFQIPYHHKPCEQCEWVENSTHGMDEWKANHFFCESKYVWDNILTKQASHIDMMVYPTRRFENLEVKCTKWMKNNGGKPPYKTTAPWLIDVGDTFKYLGNNIWRATLAPLAANIADAIDVSKIELD